MTSCDCHPEVLHSHLHPRVVGEVVGVQDVVLLPVPEASEVGAPPEVTILASFAKIDSLNPPCLTHNTVNGLQLQV